MLFFRLAQGSQRTCWLKWGRFLESPVQVFSWDPPTLQRAGMQIQIYKSTREHLSQFVSPPSLDMYLWCIFLFPGKSKIYLFAPSAVFCTTADYTESSTQDYTESSTQCQMKDSSSQSKAHSGSNLDVIKKKNVNHDHRRTHHSMFSSPTTKNIRSGTKNNWWPTPKIFTNCNICPIIR